MMTQLLNRLAIICGGPSAERGISLNSARSVVDHLTPLIEQIRLFYVAPDLKFYQLSPVHLYSNTPMDFDFKLETIAQALSEQEFVQSLKEVDLVFPAIHGTFGEDGALQGLLEQNQIPYIGPSSEVCDRMYHKPNARKVLEKTGFPTYPVLELTKNDPNQAQKIHRFFNTHQLDRAVVKPAAGGSSIGVMSVQSPTQAAQAVQTIFTEKLCDQALVEPFFKGKEFTLIILQNTQGKPVALVPSQIQISYDQNQLFDYRRKYLPTANTHWLCPPQFEDATIDKIRHLGEQLFTAFGMRDFTRMDGWLLETGEILFTDFNPISGMEQNSFIFQQGAWMGLSHQELLAYIITHACQRYGLTFKHPSIPNRPKKSVAILMGGTTAERQVSLMSGSNVWLKLRQSTIFKPTPFFLGSDQTVWSLPYPYTLSHTVEEIEDKCQNFKDQTAKIQPFQQKIRQQLGLDSQPLLTPAKYTLSDFCTHIKTDYDFLFLGLHGGIGEDGTLQKILDSHTIAYNGSGPEGAAICMDKNKTAVYVNQAQIKGVSALEKVIFDPRTEDLSPYWQKAKDQSSDAQAFIVKPQSEGCSAGIVVLASLNDLCRYCQLIKEGHTVAPAHTFPHQPIEIKLMSDPHQQLMLEPYIDVDIIVMKDHQLSHTPGTGWLELTIGILEKDGKYHAFNPSITVAAEKVLSLEEKFQGGTGINLTPPPETLIKESKRASIKNKLEEVAKILKIQNYCRIDFFYNIHTDQLIIIEANSLPALTPSTVIYHQALAEPNPISPLSFIEHLILSKPFV